METRGRLEKIKVDNDDATKIIQIIEVFMDKAEIIFLETISDENGLVYKFSHKR